MKIIGKDIPNVLVVITTVMIIAGYLSVFSKTPCESTMSYNIGRTDSGFGLTQEEFLSATKEAEAIWESAMRLDLFQYDPDSNFSISLIFDDRQQNVILADVSAGKITSDKDTYETLNYEYQPLLNSYSSVKNNYESRLRKYNSDLQSYEYRVDSYNTYGGSTWEYNYLVGEKARLNSIFYQLKNQERNLNTQLVRLNGLETKLNGLSQTINKEVDHFNTSYVSEDEINLAFNYGNRIEIYRFDNRQELISTLAHELGHSLGIDHVEDKNALMYYLTEGANYISQITDTDINELKSICNI